MSRGRRLTDRCPCGQAQLAARCCLPFLRGKAHPPTAEALMRSRYTAFVVGDLRWLSDTHDPATRAAFDEADTRQWNAGNQWISLKIIRTVDGTAEDDTGRVVFEATLRREGSEVVLTEDSTFRRVEGRWVYVDGASSSS